ncbi:MAG: cation:dicarboxylase symporter family transporter [Synergistaceae bacterium]|nr:cation:dicarboxylase symporter family transporter [Synergistaceae bacterium]
MSSPKNKSQLINILALVLGCVAGCVLNITRNTGFTYTVLAPFGSLYIRVLQFVTLPMIFCLIIVSVISSPSLKNMVLLSVGTLLCNIVVVIFLCSIVFCVAILFVSKRYITITSRAMSDEFIVPAISYMDKFMNKIPSGIFGMFLQRYLLAIFVIAIFIGILIVLEGDRVDCLTKMIISTNAVLKKMLDIILRFAPLGIFTITANAFASNELVVLKNLLGLFCMACIASLIYWLLTSFLASTVTQKSFSSYIEAEYPAIFLGFVTCSSLACVPLVQKSADDLGCRRETSSFVVPLTSLLIKPGIAMHLYCFLTFAVVASGNAMPLYKWFFMIFIAMFCSLTAPAIPMVGILMIPTALAYLGMITDPKLFGLLFAIDPFIDMIGSATTCASNVFSAVILDKIISCRKNSQASS